MSTFVGLLRAVNVASHHVVAMSDLRAFLGDVGLTDARTVLQSGNFVADTRARDATALERMLEHECARRLKIKTNFFLRTPQEWNAVVAGNPFPSEAARDPGRLAVIFLKSAPDRAHVTRLERAITGREVVRPLGRHLVAYYPDGQGRSKLNAALIERHLESPGTARNWNTVLRLKAMLETD